VSGFEFFRRQQPQRGSATVPEGLEWVPYGATSLKDDQRPRHHFVDDRRFESLWSSEYARERLAARVRFTTAPDFSIYAASTVEYSAFQMWRSAAVADELRRLGMVVVPVLLWGRPVEEELRYLASWIRPGSVVATRAHGGNVTESAESALAFLHDLIKWERCLWLGPMPRTERLARSIERMRVGQ
jgi:hypothetical protein